MFLCSITSLHVIADLTYYVDKNWLKDFRTRTVAKGLALHLAFHTALSHIVYF
jgi:hypothetical protein